MNAIELWRPQINNVYQFDALSFLRQCESGSVNCIVTSPPYFGLRDYGTPGQIGLEETPAQFVAALVAVFREAKRVLRDDGTLWINLGDSYVGGGGYSPSAPSNQSSRAGQRGIETYGIGMGIKATKDLPVKNLIGIPWRVAFALQADGWILRSDIIWSKPNPMPESVTDRPTKAHEYVFMFAKSARYWYDADAIREPAEDRPFAGKEAKTIDPNKTAWLDNHYAPGASGYGHNPAGRNKRSVWTIATEPQQSSGAVVYGTYRIASPDCPIHDYHADEARVLEYDAQLAASQSGHNPGMYTHHAPMQEGAVASIPVDQSEFPFDVSFAISRSKRSYKTPDELERDVIFSGISVDRTEYKELLHRSVAKFCRTHENNTSPDASLDEHDYRLSAQTVYRIFGTLTFQNPPFNCTCHYTGKVAKKIDHFAVFPQKLIEPMILAGCPEKVCAKCGAPWVRVTEPTPEYAATKEAMLGQTHEDISLELERGKQQGWGKDKARVTKAIVTIGFEPTCKCDKETRSGVVLDMFFGSGTTGLVARRLGRNWLGCDLSPEYVAIAKERLRRPEDPHYITKESAPLSDLPLFAALESEAAS